jgi:hypothetical protein
MADPCNDDVVEVPVETPARGSPMIGGTSGDPTILKALAAKVATAVLRKLRKEERLQKEAASAERKRLQQCQPVENASKKRERENESIQAYFASTRNFDAANKPPAPTSSLSSIMSHSNPAACIATGNQQSTSFRCQAIRPCLACQRIIRTGIFSTMCQPMVRCRKKSKMTRTWICPLLRRRARRIMNSLASSRLIGQRGPPGQR